MGLEHIKWIRHKCVSLFPPSLSTTNYPPSISLSHLNRLYPCFCALHFFFFYTAQSPPQSRLHPLQQVYKTNLLPPQKGTYHANAQNPLTTPYNGAGPNGRSASQTAFEKDVRTRSHLRDEKHAALAVLMDSELLVTYALASREVR